MGQSLHIPNELLDYILSFIDDESEFLNRHFVLEMSLWNSYFYEWTNNNLFWKDRYFFLLQKVQASSINNEIKDYKELDQISFQFKYALLFHYLNLNEKIEKLKYKTNENQAELTAVEEWKIKNREKPTKFNNLYSTNLTCLYYCDQTVFLWSAYNFERHFVNNRNYYSDTTNNNDNANLYSSGTVMMNEKESDCRDCIEIISLNEILSEESQYSANENLHGCLLLFELPKTEHCGRGLRGMNLMEEGATNEVLSKEKEEFCNKQLKGLEELLLKIHQKKKKYSFPLTICLAFTYDIIHLNPALHVNRRYQYPEKMIKHCEKKLKEFKDKLSLNNLDVTLVSYDNLDEREKVLKEYVKTLKGFPKELKIIGDSSLKCPAKICNVGIDVPKDISQVLDILHCEKLTKKEKRELMYKIYDKLNQELTFLQEKEQELKKDQENEQKVAQTAHNNEELIQNQETEKKKNCFLM
ncbi:hypothetical protein ABK040_014501 [Willaertia magna]